MRGKTLAVIFISIFALAGAIAGFVYFMHQSGLRARSNIALQEARENLETARASGDWTRSRNLLVKVQLSASEAAGLWESNSGEAFTLEGEAYLRLTKYRDAINILERASQLLPGDANVTRLTAESYHRTYLTGRKAADAGRAADLYEIAIQSGGGADVLLLAGKLQEAMGRRADADRYFDKIEQIAPNSREAEETRNLRATRREETK
ncbi:MAG: hypothetical protein HY286_03710 [Planctomycetes bacterium]|nr:hypothetical protein [Planctomycetota bacterium]